MFLNILVLSFFVFIKVYCGKENGVHLQGLSGSRPGWAYQGHLNSNERVIKLNPALRGIPSLNVSKTMEICGFYVHHESLNTFPFLIMIINKKWGNAEIRLKPEIKFEELMDRYAFQIEAYDCDLPNHFSERRYVMIEIGTANGPIFMNQTHHFIINMSLPEGSKIGEVTAFERPSNTDTSTVQGICYYKIISPSPVPFSVDNHGNLHTKTITSTSGVRMRHRFYIRATDCNIHQPRSASVPVYVDVYDKCEPHWTGLPKNIKYIRNSGVMTIVSSQTDQPSLHVCTNNCANFQMVITAQLKGKNMNIASTEMCKHDSISINKQRKLCEGSPDAINLLSYSLPSMIDSVSGSYNFNGSQVPLVIHLDNFNNLLGKSFSLLFWMKHGPMITNSPKQQIICNSDLKVMNRHHYSVFLHNCKLLLLIRKEYWEGTENQPSEWRYGPITEVCDDKWHHYAIMVNDGHPKLQIDGETYQKPAELLVEKPLREIPGNIQGTRFTVGSCYHSKTNNYVQNFIGQLAGMLLLKNNVEAVNTVRCMATCGESLLLPHIVEVMDTNSRVSMFSQKIILSSHSINDLLLMFSKLSYANTIDMKHSDQVDYKIHRNVTLDTEIRCASNWIVRVPTHIIRLNLIESPSFRSKIINKDPSITIFSDSQVEGYVKKRIPLFSNIKFVQNYQFNGYLKSCIIRPVDHTIRSYEYLDWPVALATNFHLTSVNNPNGLMLDGKQTISVYQSLVKGITFVTKLYDPRLTTRKFALSCLIEEKIVTNEFMVAVTIKEQDLNTYYVVDDQGDDKNDPDNKYQVLHSGNDKNRGFEDKVLSEKKIKGEHKTNKMLWIILPFIVLLCGIIVGAIQIHKRFYKKSFVRKNKNKRRVTEFSLNQKVKDDRTNQTMNIRMNSIGQINDISSDCPDSDQDDNDQSNNNSEDEPMTSIGNQNISIPKNIHMSYTLRGIPFDKPVDV